MDISEGLIKTLMDNSIEIGDVYYIVMDKDDGIIPKDGYETRKKYFIVLGVDGDGNIYGGLVINSKINTNLPVIVKQYHMKISKEKYSFLNYDSFVNCSQLLTTTLQKLLGCRKIGQIMKEDLDLIIEAICESPNENKMRLREFGLI